jgi:hypothetical protein
MKVRKVVGVQFIVEHALVNRLRLAKVESSLYARVQEDAVYDSVHSVLCKFHSRTDLSMSGCASRWVMSNWIDSTLSFPCLDTKASSLSCLLPVAMIKDPFSIIFSASASYGSSCLAWLDTRSSMATYTNARRRAQHKHFTVTERHLEFCS